jgi:hypothetical protein
MVALCLLNSLALFAQRHGRADSIETFARQGQRTHLLLQILNKGSRHYFCTSDLKKNLQRGLFAALVSSGF